MGENWIGKSVSINCRGDIGIFQGVIKQVTATEIVITKAVRNGIPLKKTSVEVRLTCKDIEKLELISSSNVPNLFPPKAQQQQNHVFVEDALATGLDSMKLSSGKPQNGTIVVRNKTPTNASDGKPPNGKQLPTKSPGPNKLPNNNNTSSSGAFSQQQAVQQQQPPLAKVLNSTTDSGNSNGSPFTRSRPIEINGGLVAHRGNALVLYKGENNQRNGNNGNNSKKLRHGNGNGNSVSNRYADKHSAFGTPVDDPMMDEDFDFEKNLALFDKQAIWDKIDALQQKPDLVRQTVKPGKKKYRHDENVLTSEPTQYRQIELENGAGVGSGPGGATACQEYVTDEGLVIPSIPRSTRNLIQQLAENHGLTMERQSDLLARGAADVALQLLGGSRRLTPNNQHQWPKIVVICDEPFNDRLSEIGIATGRLLACHGLKVVVYVSCSTKSPRVSHELELYAATGNLFTSNVDTLPSSDLVIAAIKSRQLTEPLRKWISDNRAPVFAIDPPAGGLEAVPAKCSILPILPLNDLGPESASGRLYLCNLGIPDKFFVDSGIKYKSPFDKAVIPVHPRKE